MLWPCLKGLTMDFMSRNKPTLFDAAKALVGPGIHYDGKTLIYLNDQTPPSDKELQKKLKELVDEWESKAYQRDRRVEYTYRGATTSQLIVALWEKVVEGKSDLSDEIQKQRLNVKKSIPKTKE